MQTVVEPEVSFGAPPSEPGSRSQCERAEARLWFRGAPSLHSLSRRARPASVDVRSAAPMSDALVLYLDGETCLEVRAGAVPGQLRAWLARLDADMDAGIDLDGAWVAAPGVPERGRFVLGRLLSALAEGRTDFARSLLIYLATRWPELAAIRVSGASGDWTAELEFR